MTGVLERINVAARILQQNPWIKDMTNSQFKSVDIDQIRREVGAAEAEAGLVVRYAETGFETIQVNGKVCCKVSAVLTYYSIDDEEMENGLEFPRSAIGYDTLDKGWNKAESMLYKNHYKGLYHIGERADDPDGMSNEEYDLLEVFRYITSYDAQGHPQRKYHDQINAIVEAAKPIIEKMKAEAEAERKRKLRAEKAAQAGDFFGGSKKKEPTTEAEFITADNTGKLDAQTRAKMQKAAEGRTKISQFAKDNPDCTIITEAKEAYGDIIVNWADGAVLHVLEALEEVGLL